LSAGADVKGGRKAVTSVDRIWQRIEAGWRLHTSPIGPDLAPGASQQVIEEVERLLEVTLPEDVRASYRRHDGGYSVELISAMDVLPLAGIAERWQILEELRHDEDWAGQPPYYFTEEVVRSGWQTGSIQPVWWHHRWIPIASDSAGNLSCLDLAPAAGGTVGQIIDWNHECGPSRVLLPSFERLLAALAEQIEGRIDELAE
jgi:cell wall assembly regulator SMI1